MVGGDENNPEKPELLPLFPRLGKLFTTGGPTKEMVFSEIGSPDQQMTAAMHDAIAKARCAWSKTLSLGILFPWFASENVPILRPGPVACVDEDSFPVPSCPASESGPGFGPRLFPWDHFLPCVCR